MGGTSSGVFDFEWDDDKAAGNIQKHGVTFEEASDIFDDEFMVTVADIGHSNEEERYLSVGLSAQGRLLVVSYAERGRIIRIISARKSTPNERRNYENDST